MSSRGFTPPDEGIEFNEGPHTIKEYVDGELVDQGEPTTKDDEFARDDAPEQTDENDL